MVDRRDQQNTLFVTFMGRAKQFEAQRSQFFTDFDGLVVLASRSDA